MTATTAEAKRGVEVLGLTLAALCWVSLATAADEPSPLKIGVLHDAPPFSSIGTGLGDDAAEAEGFKAEEAEGYTVELCLAFAESLATAQRGASAQGGAPYEPVLVKPIEQRFEMLDKGQIDILCGATTATLALRADYAVSIYTFVTVQSLLARLEPIDAENGARVGYLPGTTTEQQLRSTMQLIRAENLLPRAYEALTDTPEPVADHYDAMRKLRDEEIDVYIADRAILSRLLARLPSPARETIRLTAIPQRLEPYALVMRRDDPRSFALDVFLRDLFENQPRLADLLARHFPGQQQLDRSFFELIRFQARLTDGDRRTAR